MTFFLTSTFIVLVMWRPQEWLVPWLFGWPILDAIMGGALLTFVMERDANKISIPKRVPQFWLLLGLWVAAAMSHVPHTYFAGMMAAIPDVFKFVFFTSLLICLLDRVERIRTVLVIMVSMACVMALHALLQDSRGYGFGGLAPMYDKTLIKTGNPFRSYFFGIFSDPNDLAQILIAAIPLVFAIPKKMNLFTRLCCVGASVLLLSGFLTTQSRGGTVAILASAAVMVASVLPPKFLPWVLGFVALAGLAACPFAGGLLDASAHERVVFWGRANYEFKANMLFGIGYDMFWQVAWARASHNAFVGCYTELGLFGYVFWFGLLYLGILGTYRVRRFLGGKSKDRREWWMRRVAGMLIVSAVGFAASSYFLNRTFSYPLFFLFALLAAVPVAAREFLPAKTQARLLTAFDIKIAMPVMALLSVAYIYFSILFLNRAYGG